jgi:uroporphyrinogen-III synthase
MKIRVFISRQLRDGNDFAKELPSLQYYIVDQYLIDFQPIRFEPPATEWLFFYSKSGIKYYVEQGGEIDHHKLATFGSSTAQFLKKITGKESDYVGVGKKEQTALSFSKMPHYESCTFVVGKNSLRSISTILQCNSHQEIVVYSNEAKAELSIKNPDIAIFTSPLAVKAYFDHYPNRTHRNVAIGRTTSQSLLAINKSVDAIAKEPNERMLAMEVLRLTQ